MALERKYTSTICVLGLLCFLGAYGVNQLIMVVDTGADDPNIEQLYFFKYDHQATFLYFDGEYDQSKNLEIRNSIINETHTNASIWIDGHEISSFFVNPEGLVYQDGQLSQNFSIWWIYVPNFLSGTDWEVYEIGSRINLTDSSGFLGFSDHPYYLIIEDECVYWPTNEMLNVHGAQGSYTAGMYDGNNNQRIASLTIDYTSGMIEEWEGVKDNHLVRFYLQNTDYQISRHRITGFPYLFILGAVICVLIFLLTTIKWKNPKMQKMNISPERRNEFMALTGLGVIAFAIEWIDIWFYLYFGSYTLLLHVIYIGILGLLAYKYKYNFRWLLPPIVELLMIWVIFLVFGEYFGPLVALNLLQILSWVGFLLESTDNATKKSINALKNI